MDFLSQNVFTFHKFTPLFLKTNVSDQQHNLNIQFRPLLHGSGQNFCKDKNLHGSTMRLHGTGETVRIFERLGVQVWDLKKAGQLFDQHDSTFRTDSCKHRNRATLCSDSAVKAWNLITFCLVA